MSDAKHNLQATHKFCGENANQLNNGVNSYTHFFTYIHVLSSINVFKH